MWEMFLAYFIYEQVSVKSKEMLSPVNGNVISLFHLVTLAIQLFLLHKQRHAVHCFM